MEYPYSAMAPRASYACDGGNECVAFFLSVIFRNFRVTIFLFCSQDRWAELCRMCRSDILRLHQLGDLSIFETTLEAGLSALKTHQCFYHNLRSEACPVCSSLLNPIAERLPYSHCTQARFEMVIIRQKFNF